MRLFAIMFFAAYVSVYCQWEKTGNSERFKAHDSKIINFVQTEDSKYIFTYDKNSVLKKWDNNTGEIIWSRKLYKDSALIKYTSLFLSSDANTYLTTDKYSNPIGIYEYIYIYDIESSKLIDSLTTYKGLNFNSGSTGNSYVQGINKILDYISKQNLIMLSVYYYYYSNAHSIEKTISSGFLQLLKKNENKWDLKRDFEGNAGIICRDYALNYIYFLMYFNSSYKQNSYTTYTEELEEHNNNYYVFSEDSTHQFTSFSKKYIKEGNSQPKNTTIGKSFPFCSGFFGKNAEDLILSIKNIIYKYNLKANDFTVINKQDIYSSDKELQITNAPDSLFFIAVRDNCINFHSISDLRFLHSFKIDKIDSIFSYRNSNDGKYLFLSDYNGYLYRIPYQPMIDATLVNNPQEPNTNFKNIIFSPNPTSDYLNINSFSDILKMKKIQIFSAFGIKILEMDYRERIDISELIPGVYFIKIGDKVEKFIKI